ncbi:MAG: metallophosphoesterase [Cyclobacteriaceae bacterium]|nr:metallophosphoesterase [Cyclobacteriaceae bacterium]MCX7637663.1 metallophosphoesterase [Cyclobacteriaceae bacterium]MDW8332402.1 metallophosphoesterase [Cyclobacteriaceae bacterium]
MRTFVMGDIHGAYRALLQCLQRAQFNYASDRLIVLGDVCDGWPETRQAIDELLKLKHLIYILGNHDYWTLEWMLFNDRKPLWTKQGGAATLASYNFQPDEEHKRFLNEALPYFVLDNRLFVHGGFNPRQPLEQQPVETLIWHRDLAYMALDFYFKGMDVKLTSFDEVYLGHTPIPFDRPVYSCGIWLMDTGAGWSGVLSMMNIDTKETFVSDPVPSLYPDVPPRSKAK